MKDADVSTEDYRSALARLADAGYAGILSDPVAGDRYLFDTLAEAKEPHLREIGQQLRDGMFSLRDLAVSDMYRETLTQAVADLDRLDPEQLVVDLDQALQNTEEPIESNEATPPSDMGSR
jgi:hypothetical protein